MDWWWGRRGRRRERLNHHEPFSILQCLSIAYTFQLFCIYHCTITLPPCVSWLLWACWVPKPWSTEEWVDIRHTHCSSLFGLWACLGDRLGYLLLWLANRSQVAFFLLTLRVLDLKLRVHVDLLCQFLELYYICRSPASNCDPLYRCWLPWRLLLKLSEPTEVTVREMHKGWRSQVREDHQHPSSFLYPTL